MTGSLSHSQADIVAQLLIDLGFGTDPTLDGIWPIYVTEEPNSPDNVITVYDTVGTSDGRTQFDGEMQEHHGILIRVRSTTYPIGRTKARAIAVGLDETVLRDTVGVASVLGTGTAQYFVDSVSRKGDVISLGKESPNSKRTIFTINATVTLREV